MRIGMVSTPFIPVPPPAYGGTELIVSELVEGLRGLGHEVILYTVGKTTDPDARSLFEQPVWPPDPYHELHHAAWALSDLIAHEPVDLIHSHCGTLLSLSRFIDTPIVYTIHHDRRDPFPSYYEHQNNVRFVSISARQRALFPEIAANAEVVLHGLDPARYPLGQGGNNCVFIGRLSDEKGPHHAIDAARAAGLTIAVAGKPHQGDEPYFDSELSERLRQPGVDWIGEVDLAHKVPLLQAARALLFPIQWEEPFGLVMIESMLCGTPVLAFPRGSVPEVVEDGVTGFLCHSADEMAARLREIGSFDRRRCRARAVERFGRMRMVHDYVDVYQRAIAASRGRALFPVSALASAAEGF